MTISLDPETLLEFIQKRILESQGIFHHSAIFKNWVIPFPNLVKVSSTLTSCIAIRKLVYNGIFNLRLGRLPGKY